MARQVHCNSPRERNQARGFNKGIKAAIEVVCPSEHKEEERSCEEIKRQLEALLIDIVVDLDGHSFIWESS